MYLRRLLPVALVSASLVTAGLLSVTVQTSAFAQEPSHPTSTPYAGDLHIFDEPGRDQRLQIDYVMNILGIHRGKTVADIGAGGGWFTVRAARRVGPTGRVIAEDINPKAIDFIRQRAANEHLGNVEEVLGTPDDPRLAPDSIDAALMLKVYHEIAHPALVLAHLRAALKPGARFGIIDRNGNGADHGLDEKVLRAEVEANGFQQVARYDFTRADGQDYFLVFVKK
jgi:ubiquinone/menaquinone biosynthesis C-methylase UbiE